MGVCTTCSTKNMLDAPINDFYGNMLIRKETCEKLSIEIKSCWQKGSISEENWKGKIVKNLLGKDLDERESDEYINFWTEVFKVIETRVLILAILLLCEKNLNDFKQRFKDLSRGILKFKDSLIEVSEGLSLLISKDMLKLVLEAYFALISLHCLKYSEKVKEDDTQGKKDIEKMYELQYIKGYTEFFIAETEKAILAQKKREKVSEGFVDFDDFFEQVYHISLAKDSTARINLENYSINKIREASRAG